MLNYARYKKNPVISLSERQWPDNQIEKAPVWCSVDLRDGNQALIEPMVVEEKIEFFQMLVKLGFKEIEVGFPSASQIEYDFLRQLVERNLIPDDVIVQVLVQCREHLIERTFEALNGVKKAIVHIYNSTSALQRDVVFGKSKEEIKEIAIEGTKLVKQKMKDFEGKIILEYSPESFTGTEVDYALDVCEAVLDEWGATKEEPVIINLPATVEMNTPNVYADQIEWFHRHLKNREAVILSVHPHNDRGCAVAAAELSLLAGADRIEGTLFGNGERTGNVDILTIAYNLFSQGVNPNLNLENINEIIEVYERCCKIPVHIRHPYAGKLVFTAFSGSHQDAINKGIKAMKERNQSYWEVPYLPIDPADVGRKYEPIVRINSQSGKGGVAFIMDSCFGFKLPKGMQKEFAKIIQEISEKQGEVAPEQIMEEFKKEYLEAKEPFHFCQCKIEEKMDENNRESTHITILYKENGIEKTLEGIGNGPIDAAQKGISNIISRKLKVLDYNEHALQSGSNAQAVTYIHLLDEENGNAIYGAGISSNITRSSLRALFSAINRLNK
ncbi:2-isopropylmalate synthase [Velocimicrobium porci]|uniref:2-isopropylmalate synthase n=1 Tax=Velocimicrobium porci TaxID=2606634 RepID=A0A6L5XVA7_9FIRM|nr:2-isopropylmalate synthase [Velocimicrobium porci]MSS62642.1 2-isopropylmalate synthase [Velocimicrobium porci]